MIQRVQTLYLLLATIALNLMFFFPWMNLSATQGEYDFLYAGIKQTGVEGAIFKLNALPVAILLGLIILLSAYSIIAYKKRFIQLRITTFNMLLLIGFYIMIAAYRFLLINLDIIGANYGFPLIMPLIALIFTYMANRAIKKDEDLIKSVDRIR